MNWRVRQHEDVESDILAIARWIDRDSQRVAVRFLAAVEDTIRGLRYMPERGTCAMMSCSSLPLVTGPSPINEWRAAA